MIAYDFAVPWRDEKAGGLGGVVSVQTSDLTGNKDTLVRDVVKILNEKLESSDEYTLRKVTRISLHGVRLGNDFPLSHAVPALKAGYPRFLATTQTRPRECTMTIFVVVLSGKTISIACSPTDTVNGVKAKIEDKVGMPRESQRLVYAGLQLKDHRSLSHYRVSDNSTLQLVLTLCGGFAGRLSTPRTFADVSDGSLLTAHKFSRDAPEWRVCSKGLNIEGRCKNRDCRAYRHMIIDRKKFALLNLIQDDNVRCPICRSKVDPVTCGLYDCCWRYEGMKASDRLSMCSQWKDAEGYVYHRFDCDENGGSVEWESLLMAVKPRDEAVSAKLLQSTKPLAISADDKCTICWSSFGSPSFFNSRVTQQCSHNFHSVCIWKWTKWCERNNTRPSCPICRRKLQ